MLRKHLRMQNQKEEEAARLQKRGRTKSRGGEKGSRRSGQTTGRTTDAGGTDRTGYCRLCMPVYR